ncbi:hypothetical protein A6A08_01165 [Nocardiopsis sp. TSRI0078]|uniref:hypothetical protein n=1 Tax=unclassified Nocardiopsis TaxID=2649073 RepID=UPI0009393BD0|nr:hypothetical protein [Nocardiopsis sp. TSRI0078]OKI23438.1 hypothetical protein A6A08_01165 [Nocardiopsis sp. TSRI0078]
MGDFLSSVLPAGLIDVLSALIPPVVVGAVFCTFVIQLLRKEMAPRRMDGSLVSKDGAAKGADGGKGADADGESGAADGTPIVRDGERAESDGR